MDFLTGVKQATTVEISDILEKELYGQELKINGAVHIIRDMGEFAFVVLRKRDGVVQCVFNKEKMDMDFKEIHEGTTVKAVGTAAKEDRAPNGFEITLESVKILSQPAAQMPIPIGKWKMKTSLETKYNSYLKEMSAYDMYFSASANTP